ncbi:hypothetical protein ACLB2K_007370 [Fragaria x ananassa]
MLQEHEDLDLQGMVALDHLMVEKKRVAQIYDKRTKGCIFGVRDLVWKVMLPLGEKLHGQGKWAPKWKGPFVIDHIDGNSAYRLRDVDGDIPQNPINGRYLKKYFPEIWEFDDPPLANVTEGQDLTA